MKWQLAVGNAQHAVRKGSAIEIKSYRDLEVWQEAMAIAERTYRLTAEFSRDEVYGMTSQIRRSATSVGGISARDMAGRTADRTFSSFELHRAL